MSPLFSPHPHKAEPTAKPGTAYTPSPVLPWLVATAFFMQMLDATILNTALPAIATSLNESPLSMNYALIAYTLTVALLIPASGWAADNFGTRRVFIAALVLFSLGSLFCAMAPTLLVLIVARVLQGIGGAMMVPVGRLTVLRAYPREQLLQVLAFVTIPGLLGPLMGPTLGGLLTQYASWHWIFLINLPVGAIGVLVALKYMPDFRATVAARFDFRGFALVSTSMVMLSAGLAGFGELHMNSAVAMLLLLSGMVFMFLYWLSAMRSQHPLFSPLLFRIPTFAVGIAGNLFSRLASGALPFLTPLLLQLGFGFSPVVSGLSMTPLALAAMFSKYMVRGLIKRFGYRRLLVTNTLVLGCTIMGFSQVSAATPHVLLLAMLTLIGACNSLQFTAMNTMTLMDLPEDLASSGNAMLSVVMQLAVSMGVAIATALLKGFGVGLGGPAMLAAFNSTYICVGAVAMLSSTIFLLVPKEANANK